MLIFTKKCGLKKKRLIDRFVIVYRSIRNQCQAVLLPDDLNHFAICLIDC